MNRFVIYAVAGRVPSVIHNDLETAITEAKRIAQKENSEVVIFGEIGTCKPAETPVVFKWKEGFKP